MERTGATTGRVGSFSESLVIRREATRIRIDGEVSARPRRLVQESESRAHYQLKGWRAAQNRPLAYDVMVIKTATS